MSLYCMCEAENDKPDSQEFMAPNRYCAAKKNDDFPPLALRKPMTCIKSGARQVILDYDQDKPNNWEGGSRPDHYRPHYPNVDVFECPNCGARICKE